MAVVSLEAIKEALLIREVFYLKEVYAVIRMHWKMLFIWWKRSKIIKAVLTAQCVWVMEAEE